jgi:hypothetical protein
VGHWTSFGPHLRRPAAQDGGWPRSRPTARTAQPSLFSSDIPKDPPMASSPDSHEIAVEVDGRLAGIATVSPTNDPAVVRSAMHVESGHLPPGARSSLVDAVLDDPEVRHASHLSASMPTGDTEMVDRVRERADQVELRATGATKLVEADLPADRAPRAR